VNVFTSTEYPGDVPFRNTLPHSSLAANLVARFGASIMMGAAIPRYSRENLLRCLVRWHQVGRFPDIPFISNDLPEAIDHAIVSVGSAALPGLELPGRRSAIASHWVYKLLAHVFLYKSTVSKLVSAGCGVWENRSPARMEASRAGGSPPSEPPTGFQARNGSQSGDYILTTSRGYMTRI